MDRPSFENVMMSFAGLLASRSTCARLNVGCVITSTDFRHIYGVGYNGNVRGGPNDCDRHGDQAIGFCGCVHAESNAIANCGNLGSDKFVFVTAVPCVACAKLLINMGGVRKVFWRTAYRLNESPEWFKGSGIELIQQEGSASFGSGR